MRCSGRDKLTLLAGQLNNCVESKRCALLRLLSVHDPDPVASPVR